MAEKEQISNKTLYEMFYKIKKYEKEYQVKLSLKGIEDVLKNEGYIKEDSIEKLLNDARVHFSCVLDYCKKQIREKAEYEHLCQVQLKYEEAITKLQNEIEELKLTIKNMYI